MRAWANLIVVFLALAGVAQAGTVGELHRTTESPTASIRDAQHRPTLRITLWYPAADTAKARPLTIGPPERPLFQVGSVAPDAAFAPAPARGWPVIMLSHGFGGSARMMGWFGIALARAGYVVVAVDHPGNNGVDPMTLEGAVLWWERAADLRLALAAVKRDPAIGPQLDLHRLGVAGFSAGGFTALVAAGVRVDPAHFDRFCHAHPDDAVCKPQLEQPMKIDVAERPKLFEKPPMAALGAHAGDDYSLPGVRAAFALAPALVQAMDPASLVRLRVPVSIVLGAQDAVAPPATNGLVAAKAIAGAQLSVLPRVGHYDFLADCTEAGRAAVPQCMQLKVSQEATHQRAIHAALAFFAKQLR